MTQQRTALLAALAGLLDEALELTPEGRPAMLARVRAEHPELAAELEALLALEPELDAGRFLVEGQGDATSDRLYRGRQ